jgi:hypothetical protein
MSRLLIATQKTKVSLTLIAAELENVGDLLYQVGLDRLATKVDNYAERIRNITDNLEAEMIYHTSGDHEEGLVHAKKVVHDVLGALVNKSVDSKSGGRQ